MPQIHPHPLGMLTMCECQCQCSQPNDGSICIHTLEQHRCTLVASKATAYSSSRRSAVVQTSSNDQCNLSVSPFSVFRPPHPVHNAISHSYRISTYTTHLASSTMPVFAFYDDSVYDSQPGMKEVVLWWVEMVLRLQPRYYRLLFRVRIRCVPETSLKCLPLT